jgi:hypothetical protein
MHTVAHWKGFNENISAEHTLMLTGRQTTVKIIYRTLIIADGDSTVQYTSTCIIELLHVLLTLFAFQFLVFTGVELISVQ